MNFDGDAYFLMRGRVCSNYDDVMNLAAPLRWIYADQLKRDLDAERAAYQSATPKV